MTAVKTVRALTRGLEVLCALRTHPGSTLSQLHAHCKLPKATLLRMLKTLEQADWVYCSLAEGTYWISTRRREFGACVQPANEIAQVAAPVLERLCQRVIWPSDLAVRDGARMMVVETSRRNTPFLVNRDVFAIRPHMLKSALGRAYLAFCSDDERRQIITTLRRSKDPEDLAARDQRRTQALLTSTHRRGYGVREANYWAGHPRLETDVHAIAVPVIAGERVAACMSLLWIGDTLSLREFQGRYLKTLQAAAATVASRLRTHGSGAATADSLQRLKQRD